MSTSDFGFVLRVCSCSSGKQLFIPQSLGANGNSALEHFCSLPQFFKVRRSCGFCSRGFKIRSQLTVIQAGRAPCRPRKLDFRIPAERAQQFRHAAPQRPFDVHGSAASVMVNALLNVPRLELRSCVVETAEGRQRACLGFGHTSRSRRGLPNKRKQICFDTHGLSSSPAKPIPDSGNRRQMSGLRKQTRIRKCAIPTSLAAAFHAGSHCAIGVRHCNACIKHARLALCFRFRANPRRLGRETSAWGAVRI